MRYKTLCQLQNIAPSAHKGARAANAGTAMPRRVSDGERWARGHWNTSLRVSGGNEGNPYQTHARREKSKTSLERHVGLGNSESGWVSRPRSLAVANGGPGTPKGELCASGVRLETPRRVWHIHVSFLKQSREASPKLCHAYIWKDPQVRPQTPTFYSDRSFLPAAKSLQLRLSLQDSMDCNLPGSSEFFHQSQPLGANQYAHWGT